MIYESSSTANCHYHSAYVTALCRHCYYHLRPAAARSLSTATARTFVQAFVSCHLDYCNSLTYGVADSLIRRVQSVQNVAAWLINHRSETTGTHHASATSVALAPSPSTNAVQTLLYHVQVTGQTHQYLADDVQLLADSGRRLLPTTEHASFLGHRTLLATETFLLSDLQSGTVCHNCSNF